MNQKKGSLLFYVWPRFAVRHPWVVIFGAVLALAMLIVVSQNFKGRFSDSFSLPASESQRAADLLNNRFPQAAGDSATVVVQAPAGFTDLAALSSLQDLLASLRGLPDVVNVSSPLDDAAASVSKDGTIAKIAVEYDAKERDLPQSSIDALAQLRAASTRPGFRVEVGGSVNVDGRPGLGSTELIGVLAAVVILVIAFGSVVAMSLPILTALLGLGSSVLIIAILARFVTMPSFTTAFAAMIGIGVGIDYALLIVTRFREGLARGLSTPDAVVNASATAGRSVLFAGITVLIAMLGLWLVGISFMAYVGTAAAIVVGMAVLIALTVLPAVLRLVGTRVNSLHVPGMSGVSGEATSGFGYRLSRIIQKHPVVAMAGSLAILLLLASPVLSLRLGSSDAGSNSTKFTSRRAYDLLTQGFDAGKNTVVLVALSIDNQSAMPAVQALPDALRKLPDVGDVSQVRFNADSTAATISVSSISAPQDAATKDLVHAIRDEVHRDIPSGSGASAYVGGQTAAFIDLSDIINSHLPVFFGAVIGLSFLLLVVVFRSIVVPIKAALMNVLAIGASYGVLVAVFQWGWGAGLIGAGRSGPIESFLPMFLFAILFGLSMDYEVFLVTRIHEEYLNSRNNSESVARGLAVTSRLITAAAAIMVAVFLSFAFGDSRIIKEFGIGLAAAVFVDATLIRLLLVPALMQLMGDANWWFPSWLDRYVPRVHVEPVGEPALATTGK